VFHPNKALHIDKVAAKDLIQTVAITLPKKNPDLSQDPRVWLKDLEPGDTMVFKYADPRQRAILENWIRHSTHLVGMNIWFDITYLWAMNPTWFSPFSHTIVDLSVLIYLEYEQRVELSLKSIGPVLGLYIYNETLKGGHRFPNPKALGPYNAQDTHNTMLCVQELSKKILQSKFPGDKLSPYCISHFSDLIWLCILMQSRGICFNQPALVQLERMMLSQMVAISQLAAKYGLIISGTGSEKSKKALLNKVIEEVDKTLPGKQTVLDDKRLEKTEKREDISFSQENRNLLRSFLPKNHPINGLLRLADLYAVCEKTHTTYLMPLLKHQSKRPSNKKSIIIPDNTEELRHG